MNWGVCQSYQMLTSSTLESTQTNFAFLMAFSVAPLRETTSTVLTEVGFEFKVGASMINSIAQLTKLSRTQFARQSPLLSARPLFVLVGDIQGSLNHVQVL